MWGPQSACPAGVDDSLGPWAGDECRDGFDFTLLFEEAVLAVPLHCLLLLVLPACALRLAGADVKVVASTQRALKAVPLNLALLVLWATTSSAAITHTRATIPAAVLGLLASLGVGLLSWLEHDRSVRPSFVLSTYLFLSVLLDTARARTLWMLGPNQTIPAIFTCTLALKAVMILLESTEKRRILVPQHKGYSKEVTSGTFNRSVFFWLTSLFINGYRNILKLEDLYPLDPKLASEPLYKKLADAWDQVPDKTRPGALFSTWLRVFAGPMSAAVVPKLFQIGFNYAQPLLIQQAIELAGLPQTREYRNRGFGLIGAYVLVYTGIAVSTGQYEWRTHRTAAMLRGSTTALIYQKALRLDLTSPNVSPAGALTLVGTDSEQISQGVNQLHEIWGGLVEIGIGIYLIYRQLGAACAMPVALVFVPTGKASAQWIKASQDRVTTTSKTLGSIKWLKVSGLNDVAFSVIQNLRSTELVVSKRYRVLLGISMMLTFTAISILTLVNQPLAGIIMALPITATAVTSFQRIQDFLNGKERADTRVATAIARALYARQELLLLDDVFSGLDPGTEEIVFGNLLGSNGLLRNNDTTVVLVSSDYTSGLGNEKPPKAVINALEEQADATRQLGDWAMYSFYAKAAGWFSLSMFAGFMIVFAFFDSFPDIWLKWWTEANEQRPNQDLGKWVGIYTALGVGSIVSFFISIWFLFIVIINHSGVYFHSVLLDTTSRAPMAFHSSVDSGVTVNRFSQDLQLIDMELPAAALGVAVGVVFGIARFVMMSVSSRYMAVILPFLVPAFYALQHFYLRTSRQMRLLDIEHKAPLYTQLIETLEGLATIRAFKWEDAFEAANMHRLDDSQRPSYLLSCLQRWLTFAVDMTITVIALILIVLVTTLREQIGPAFIGIALNNVLSFSGVIKALITSWVMLEVSLGAVARVRNFAASTKPEGASDELREPEGEWPSRGAVELRDVTASYLGKSSIVLSLLRMLDLDSGSITVDGIDLSTLPHEYVRSHLVAVPQESYIFDGSVRLNIDPTETVPDSDVVEALEKVQLWVKVEERGGLDALIDDKFFSQGEAQLLVFARAMLRKGRVLILDEITSSLNDESSHVIDEVLRSWFQDWTIIAIAHKLESIVDFDRVAVVDAGELIEYGRPKELLERNSAFKALYERSSTMSD
ncbi:hypothetical protein COL940_003955 [Colletotrichum noveboracense]|nr:hypothetical protein COL940_003955 [Colletotrichum noveboracense]